MVRQILYTALYYPLLKIPWSRAIAVMPNLSPLSASSDADCEGMVGVTVVLRLSAQSAVHSRYLVMFSLQRTQRGHPTARKGRSTLSKSLWTFAFILFVLFSISFIFDCDIAIVYSVHVLLFLYLGGQLDKLCFSVHPASRNELHTDRKLYHVLLLGK